MQWVFLYYNTCIQILLSYEFLFAYIEALAIFTKVGLLTLNTVK